MRTRYTGSRRCGPSEADGVLSTRIVAITPVHDRRELTLQCLRSLFASDLTGIDLRVVVVDDGSTDGTAAAIESEFGDSVTIVHGDGSLFYSGGMNRGIAAASALNADYVLGFNDDSVFPPDCLQQLVACAKRYPGSIVGPLLLDWDRPENIFQIAPEFHIRYGGWRHWMRQRVDTVPDSPFIVDSIAGNCVLLPAGALDQNCRLDSDRLKHYGDTELTVRLRRQGWTLIIAPEARLLCQPNTPPPRLRQLSATALLRHLFLDDATPHNLRHRFWHTYLTAPGRVAGVLAFAVFVCRLAGRAVGLQRRWPATGDEPPLHDRHSPLPVPTSRTQSGPAPSIWYIWRYREFGGVQSYLLHAAAVAKRFGFETRALIPADSPPHTVDLLEAHGIAVYAFSGAADVTPYRSIRQRLRRRLHNLRVDRILVARLTDLIRDDPRPAVLHTDIACWVERRVSQALLAVAPLVCTVFTPLPRARGWRRLQRRMNLRALMSDRRFVLTTQTGTTKRSLASCVSPAGLDAIRVSPAAIDAAEIDRLTSCARSRSGVERDLALPPSELRMGVIGQLIPRKGYAVLLEALELLVAAGVDAQVLWFCAGSDEADRRLPGSLAADRFHVRDGAAFDGGLRGALPAVRSATDLFVLPSLEEGFPLALAEAMGMGMACVSTRVGAIPEVVRDGRNGVLVEPGDARALAAAVARLAGDAALRERLGRAARATALETFARDNAALPTIDAYRRLAEAQT